MNIALDFGGVIEEDKTSWFRIAEVLQKLDHNVYVMTNRPFRERKHIEGIVLQGPFEPADIMFCGNEPKKTVAKKNNLDIDVWIDNKPESIIMASE